MASYRQLNYVKQPKPICKISQVYDEAHYARFGADCHLKHTLYRWPATVRSQGTLISDSLCKWVRGIHYLDVQSIPGLRIETAIQHIESGFLRVDDYEFVFLHVRTNNVVKMPIDELKWNMRKLMNLIKSKNHFTTIAVSSILHRPKQPDLETYRMTVNNSLQKLCIQEGHHFLESWRKMEDASGRPKKGLYAEDDLHFNDKGIAVLRDYFDGAIGMLADKKHKME